MTTAPSPGILLEIHLAISGYAETATSGVRIAAMTSGAGSTAIRWSAPARSSPPARYWSTRPPALTPRWGTASTILLALPEMLSTADIRSLSERSYGSLSGWTSRTSLPSTSPIPPLR